MRPGTILFGFCGRIGRIRFLVGSTSALVAFWLAIQASLAALPWMAEVLAPRGINAGFALNMIWLVAGVVFVWSLCALGAKRLRDIGHPPWWAPAAVLPLAALALLNDAIFLVSRSFVLPPFLQWPILLVSGGLALWVLVAGLIMPTRAEG